jgi:hypothetical protein
MPYSVEQPMTLNQKLDGMLIVIGAMKCGTSSLHNYLKLHPEISMSSNKELNFFVAERNWFKGIDWYKRNFDWSKKIRGESSTNYTKYHLFPGVPKRIAACISDATLIYLMRDPIDRIVSHYLTNVSLANETRSLEEALTDFENNKYVETSRYYTQIGKFLEYFDRSQLLLFTLEELHNHPHKVCRDIFSKVGVDPDFSHSSFHEIHHRTSLKRRPTSLALKISRYPGGRAVRSTLPFLLERSLDKQSLPQEVRSCLIEELKPDIDALRKFWDRDLTHWSL